MDRKSTPLRLATLHDAVDISALIERSVMTLQADDYTEDQRRGAIGSVFGVDRQLIRDGTYFVAERDGRMVGCGGWSRRRTLYGGDEVATKDDSLLNPSIDAARIRAFFIAPGYERQGIGSQIMKASEDAAISEGFTELELAATLTGVYLYRRHGFDAVERYNVVLKNGLDLPLVRMRKSVP